MAFQGHFVGYGDLEQMLKATDECGDIFANCIFESSPAQPQTGMDFCSTVIQVSRINGEIVHYWRWKVAVVLTLASGEPFSAVESRRAHIEGESAWAVIKNWLQERTKVIEATVAMPKNMNFPGGEQPSFLGYEKTTTSYTLREASRV